MSYPVSTLTAQAGIYAWVITIDKINDDKCSEGTTGPRGATDEQIAKAEAKGRAFRMLDDDGIVNFHGRIWADEGSEDDFGPLDDFGAPDSGCTEIQYFINGKWETL